MIAIWRNSTRVTLLFPCAHAVNAFDIFPFSCSLHIIWPHQMSSLFIVSRAFMTDRQTQTLETRKYVSAKDCTLKESLEVGANMIFCCIPYLIWNPEINQGTTWWNYYTNNLYKLASFATSKSGAADSFRSPSRASGLQGSVNVVTVHCISLYILHFNIIFSKPEWTPNKLN